MRTAELSDWDQTSRVWWKLPCSFLWHFKYLVFANVIRPNSVASEKAAMLPPPGGTASQRGVEDVLPKKDGLKQTSREETQATRCESKRARFAGGCVLSPSPAIIFKADPLKAGDSKEWLVLESGMYEYTSVRTSGTVPFLWASDGLRGMHWFNQCGGIVPTTSTQLQDLQISIPCRPLFCW